MPSALSLSREDNTRAGFQRNFRVLSSSLKIWRETRVPDYIYGQESKFKFGIQNCGNWSR